MIRIAILAVAVQAVVMLIDELHYHRRRRLPRWERIGHPLDTLSVLACYAVALLLPATHANMRVFAGLALVSCLLVTKDEFVHSKYCTAAEQWLHAVLFVMHPIVMASIALLWIRQALPILLIQAALTFAFGLYQVLCWNTAWGRWVVR